MEGLWIDSEGGSKGQIIYGIDPRKPKDGYGGSMECIQMENLWNRSMETKGWLWRIYGQIQMEDLGDRSSMEQIQGNRRTVMEDLWNVIKTVVFNFGGFSGEPLLIAQGDFELIKTEVFNLADLARSQCWSHLAIMNQLKRKFFNLTDVAESYYLIKMEVF